jgi:hypothetical protein
MRKNRYLKKAIELIDAGVMHIDASETNLMFLSAALRAADFGDIETSKRYMRILENRRY